MGKKLKGPLDSLLDEISPLEQTKTDTKMMLAARIADAMKAKKWKNNDLLTAVGKTNPSVITKWLSGTHNFTVETLVELEEALDISLLDIEEKKQETIMTFHYIVRKEVQLYSEPDDFNQISIVKENENLAFNKEYITHYNSLNVRS